MQVNNIHTTSFKHDKRLSRFISFIWTLKVKITLILSGSLVILMLFGCIDEFDPKIKDYEDLVVIDGSIIKEDSIQKVFISRSTEVFDPLFNPISDCKVSVTDIFNNEFVFEETEPGTYTAKIPEVYLTYDNKFQLLVKTPAGKEYLSDTVSILESSPIDSLYYNVEQYQSSSEQFDKGLQFYTDLKAPEDATKNYRWTVEETWEIQTFYSIDGAWKTWMIRVPVYDPIDGFKICWSTRKLSEFYTASTENLVVNEKKRIPLNFVPSKSTKLDVKYSILVRQYSLSAEAYHYHDQNNYSSSGSEGLYQKQPGQTRSNIRNSNNPDEIVLGYFWASSYTQKRIFFTGPLTNIHTDCDYIVRCIPKEGQTLLQFFQALGRDVYLIALDVSPTRPDSVRLWGFPFNQICIDCTADGGSLEKPDFWK